jgi:hypothetical protein
MKDVYLHSVDLPIFSLNCVNYEYWFTAYLNSTLIEYASQVKQALCMSSLIIQQSTQRTAIQAT